MRRFLRVVGVGLLVGFLSIVMITAMSDIKSGAWPEGFGFVKPH